MVKYQGCAKRSITHAKGDETSRAPIGVDEFQMNRAEVITKKEEI